MPRDNASSAPESPVTPKDQEKPWYIQHFTKLLIGFGLGGGTVAILLPWILWLLCGMSSGSSDQLRLHLLYVTGGIIAVLTLLQTNWKNQGDRLKIDADIKKNEQDAEKNERDHIRQVHAERRSRYTAAVGQLADEKAAIRLGGIYTLVGLVDEWLADSTLSEEEQQKEGQVIINSLCSYIRSPFPLAEKIDEYEARKELEELKKQDSKILSGYMSSRLEILRERFEDSAEYEEPKDITADRAQLREEQDVRRAIFEEMSKRNSTFTKDDKGKIINTTLGMWSDFDFNFSGAPIFFPLNNLTIEQGQFSSARFYGEANFRSTEFIGDAYFGSAEFTGNADFGGAEFTGNAYFLRAKFTRDAYFGGTEFTGNADFRGAKFTEEAYFLRAKFTENADFSNAKFARSADFLRAKFTGNADFSNTKFTGDADFSKAKFTGNTSFDGTYFEKSEPTFADASGSARFSAQVNPQDHLFEARPESPHSFSCGEAELLNRTFILPIGAVLYDPDSWDEEQQEYTRVSEPAQ